MSLPRTIGSSTLEVHRDSLGRVTEIEAGALGTFAYTYSTGDTSSRPERLDYADPAGLQWSTFEYEGAAGDFRLSDLDHTTTGGALSAFDYAYDNDGLITQWTQSPVSEDWVLDYDTLRQLDQVLQSSTNRFDYAYDAAGNRTSEQVNSGTAMTWTYDIGNKLDTQSSPSASYTFDAAGNLTDDGTREYEWDHAGRLARIIYSDTTSTEFTYDGLNRRVRIKEKSALGVTTSDKRFVWCGLELCEERDGGTPTTVNKRFFSFGVVEGSTPYYYTRDQLGSVREITNASGTVQSRYKYEPYGEMTTTTGGVVPDFGYAGYYWHSKSLS